MQDDNNGTRLTGAGISVNREGRPRATTDVAGQGNTAVGWAGQAKVSPTTALCAVALAAPPPGAAATPISQTRGEEPHRSAGG
jgi:hypothetical protein